MTDWSDADERAAADLWRRENPQMSVFDVEHELANHYRARIREARQLRNGGSTMTMTEERARRRTATEALDDRLTALMARMRLDGWNQLTGDVQPPPMFAAALITGRPELARAVTPPKASELSDDDVAKLCNLIAVLIETNAALQDHAQEVSKLVKHWSEAFTALRAIGWRVEAFANFRRTDDEAEAD